MSQDGILPAAMIGRPKSQDGILPRPLRLILNGRHHQLCLVKWEGHLVTCLVLNGSLLNHHIYQCLPIWLAVCCSRLKMPNRTAWIAERERQRNLMSWNPVTGLTTLQWGRSFCWEFHTIREQYQNSNSGAEYLFRFSRQWTQCRRIFSSLWLHLFIRCHVAWTASDWYIFIHVQMARLEPTKSYCQSHFVFGGVCW